MNTITYYRMGDTYAAVGQRGNARTVGVGDSRDEAKDSMSDSPLSIYDPASLVLDWVTSQWAQADAADGEWEEIGPDSIDLPEYVGE